MNAVRQKRIREGVCARCRQRIRWYELPRRSLVVAVVDYPILLSDRDRTKAEERADPHGDAAVFAIVDGEPEPRWYWSDPDGELVGFELHERLCPWRLRRERE